MRRSVFFGRTTTASEDHRGARRANAANDNAPGFRVTLLGQFADTVITADEVEAIDRLLKEIESLASNDNELPARNPDMPKRR